MQPQVGQVRLRYLVNRRHEAGITELWHVDRNPCHLPLAEKFESSFFSPASHPGGVAKLDRELMRSDFANQSIEFLESISVGRKQWTQHQEKSAQFFRTNYRFQPREQKFQQAAISGGLVRALRKCPMESNIKEKSGGCNGGPFFHGLFFRRRVISGINLDMIKPHGISGQSHVGRKSPRVDEARILRVCPTAASDLNSHVLTEV